MADDVVAVVAAAPPSPPAPVVVVVDEAADSLDASPSAQPAIAASETSAAKVALRAALARGSTSVCPSNVERRAVRAVVESIADVLIHRHRSSGRVDLNDVAEVIDARAVSYEEVDWIIARLEAEGLVVGEAPGDLGIAGDVVARARALSLALGRTPTVAEIAADTGRPEHAIRRALEQVARVGKGKPKLP